jgi:hypothetical protein
MSGKPGAIFKLVAQDVGSKRLNQPLRGRPIHILKTRLPGRDNTHEAMTPKIYPKHIFFSVHHKIEKVS